MLEPEIKVETEELRQTVTDIKAARQRYHELLNQIPNVDDLSDEEVDKRSGRASVLLDIASEIAVMKIHVPRKVEKLQSLLKHPSQ